MRTINRYSSPPLLYLTYLTHLYPRPPCTLFEVNPVLFVPHAGCSCCRLFYKSIAEAHFLWFSTSSSVACHSAGSRCFKGELDTVFMGWPGGRTSKEMPRSHLKKNKKTADIKTYLTVFRFNAICPSYVQYTNYSVIARITGKRSICWCVRETLTTCCFIF